MRLLRVISTVPLLIVASCWKDEFAQIPTDVVAYRPEVDAPEGWLVTTIPLDLSCPDGESARSYLLYPQEAEGGDPIPGAILYHSGGFDFVFAPEATDPLTGTHYADPSRLSAQWAIRQVFATLGMYPDQDDKALFDGSLPAELARAGVAVMLPANCWGDLWSNKQSGAANDFASDFFFREGLAAAEWSYRFLVDPAFAAAFDVELPIRIDTGSVYAIGLGEGSRAIAELLSIDNNDDALPDYQVNAVVLDSPYDDLRVYFDDVGLYASTVEGLSRIFPKGPDSTVTGSFATAPLPPRVGYLYSTLDPVLPLDINDEVLARLQSSDTAWVYEADTVSHILSNSTSDVDLAHDVVAFLIDGTRPVR